MRQWEIEARPTGLPWTLRYLVAPGESLKETHERLLRDDPVWQKPRIRLSQEFDPAREFWGRCKIHKLAG